MYLEAQRFYLFLLVAAFLSALGTYILFDLSTPLPRPALPKNPLHKHHAKYAYATFLGPPTSKDENATTDDAHLQDPYFTSVRLLNWQLQYAEKTRTHLAAPFLVLVLPSVPKEQVDMLKFEGAAIISIEPLDLPDAFNKGFIENSRFRDVLAKLRLWELTDWDKIIYLDADSYLLQNLDGLFTDPSLSPTQVTLPSNTSTSSSSTSPGPPPTYLLAASADTYGPQLSWEEPGHINYLCACFMLFSPSAQLFQYYIEVLGSDEAPKDAYYPEQDLLIYVHRAEGRMPWRRIPVRWSANDGEMNDVLTLKGGVRSLHVKGWEGAEGGNVANEKYKGVWRDLVKEMERYWEGIRALDG